MQNRESNASNHWRQVKPPRFPSQSSSLSKASRYRTRPSTNFNHRTLYSSARGTNSQRNDELQYSLSNEASMEEEEEEEEAVAAGWVGSPWDMPERPQVNIHDLDLSRSYVNNSNLKYSIKSGSSRALSNRQPRWTHNCNEPLTDCSKLPEGWNMNEPDLNPEDIDANIQRAKQRIEDNIMPHAFQWRLLEYEKKREYRKYIISKWPKGLSWNVLQRLESLEFLQGKLELEDPYEQLPNVKSIALEINDLVTYWSHGTQISQPRPFNWDELLAINTHYEGSQGFWVEGVGRYEENDSEILQLRILTSFYSRSTELALAEYKIAVRIPGVKWWTELDFIFDTGADRMEIFDSDIPLICGPHKATFRTIGSTQVYGMHTEADRHVIIVEVCLLDENIKRMTPWTMIDCNIVPGNPQHANLNGSLSSRVDGPVFRHLLYNCFVPDGQKNIFISITKRGMRLSKPLAIEKREPPPIGQGIINLEATPVRNMPNRWPDMLAAEKNLPGRARGVPGPKHDTWPNYNNGLH
ncbi:hypothetical protein N7540_012472 [Penicillium herquei]|nr:hypothetical protein N7540_012472 [Penicillium herquei]